MIANFLRCLEAEFLKTRKSVLVFLLLLLFFLFPLCYLLMIDESFFTTKFSRWLEATKSNNIKIYYYYQFLSLMRLPFSLGVCVLVVYVFSIEKGIGKLSPLLMMPANAMSVFWSKFFIITFYLLLYSVAFLFSFALQINNLASQQIYMVRTDIWEYLCIGTYFGLSAVAYIFFCIFLYTTTKQGAYILFMLSAFPPLADYMPICPGAFFSHKVFLQSLAFDAFVWEWLLGNMCFFVLSLYLFSARWKRLILNQ
ncbi:MAG: hypothetical protein EAZ55_09860 [Cytophagales bacterium]|nr:MAG: hypothetical protein EAZ55_09860 [Cytophagales bacterium]